MNRHTAPWHYSIQLRWNSVTIGCLTSWSNACFALPVVFFRQQGVFDISSWKVSGYITNNINVTTSWTVNVCMASYKNVDCRFHVFMLSCLNQINKRMQLAAIDPPWLEHSASRIPQKIRFPETNSVACPSLWPPITHYTRRRCHAATVRGMERLRLMERSEIYGSYPGDDHSVGRPPLPSFHCRRRLPARRPTRPIA